MNESDIFDEMQSQKRLKISVKNSKDLELSEQHSKNTQFKELNEEIFDNFSNLGC